MDDLSFLDNRTLNAIAAAVRKSFAYNSIEYQNALTKACTLDGPKGGKRWKCSVCKVVSDRKDIHVDHIEPVIPIDTTMSRLTLKQFYDRCFCSSKNLQILCRTCHKIKTIKENETRKNFKNLRKVS